MRCLVAISMIALLVVACGGGGGSSCPVGAEGCACDHGGTCDAPLTCSGGICVQPADADTDAPEDFTTDTPDDPIAETECSEDEDCDDLDPCTDDECAPDVGECTHAPADLDADGFPAMQVDGVECTGGTDCDDDRDDVYPGAAPDCTGEVDRDCDGLSDPDEDGDGYTSEACGGDDCDDADADAFPGSIAMECDRDRDCNGHPDGDNDGDGHDSEACGGDDCDDGHATVNPGTSELNCDGLDNDCNGEMAAYEDADHDGWAHEGCALSGLDADCDDADAGIHPGAATSCDLVDDDCTGSWQDESGSDDDGDGFLDGSCGGDDCDDDDPDAYPRAPELCTDGVDQNCDTVDDCHYHEVCAAGGECEATFVTVAAGIFTMGAPVGEPGRFDDEVQHEVTLTRSFEIQTVEVTQGQFDALMGYNLSAHVMCGNDCPVEQVNWYEAAAYANAASVRAGLPECYSCTGSGDAVLCEPSTAYSTPYDCPGYRLPTEAEWEYAARAGTTEGTYNGTSSTPSCAPTNDVLDPIAWYCGDATTTTQPVGSKAPNDWGLFDVIGNVKEWCHDWYADYGGDETDPYGPSTGSYRMNRGGSYSFPPYGCRCAYRGYDEPENGFIVSGFRLVRTLF